MQISNLSLSIFNLFVVPLQPEFYINIKSNRINFLKINLLTMADYKNVAPLADFDWEAMLMAVQTLR